MNRMIITYDRKTGHALAKIEIDLGPCRSMKDVYIMLEDTLANADLFDELTAHSLVSDTLEGGPEA